MQCPSKPLSAKEETTRVYMLPIFDMRMRCSWTETGEKKSMVIFVNQMLALSTRIKVLSCFSMWAKASGFLLNTISLSDEKCHGLKLCLLQLGRGGDVCACMQSWLSGSFTNSPDCQSRSQYKLKQLWRCHTSQRQLGISGKW